MQDGRPLNPHGRTGIAGRGRLGRWGPNHAADPVVSRWKRRDDGSIQKVQDEPVLEFVAIKRGDNGQWAIPGVSAVYCTDTSKLYRSLSNVQGMVDPGELISKTLLREFMEEAQNALDMDKDRRQEREAKIEKFFSERGEEIFRGVVSSDPRNTDNAWMETVVCNFHDDEVN